MAGRGRRTMSFSVDSVGISRGETLPPAVQQPTPVFPVMEQKPLPLTGGEEAEYLTALKQDFRGAMRGLPCFIQPAAAHRDVERYSDKYHLSEKKDGLTDWIIGERSNLSISEQSNQNTHQRFPCRPTGGALPRQQTLHRLHMAGGRVTLEKKEEQESSEEEGEEKKKQKEEEAEAEEEYDEEEFEEETDYIMSYFDNGEDFGGDSDDNMDEAIY
uniref:RNA polymerase III subunit G like n=1 Tax=Fundulus heteroclitus TaxID=8078 RepID=A0A3Q2TAM2_FUNHE